MVKFASFTLAFFTTCLFVLSYAIPVKDISSTSVGISKIHNFPSAERFVVAVQRVDDFVNDAGDLLVERISAVIINFDLRDEQLLVNNVPVPLGINSIQVIKAQIIPKNKDINQYENNFDNGLITVEVNTAAESLSTEEKGVSLRRVKISVRITEIGGAKVNQVDMIKKVFEFKSLKTVDGGQNLEIATVHIKGHSCMIKRLRHWWHSSSWLVHLVIFALFFTSIFGIFFIIVRNTIEDFMVSLFPQTPYQIICQYDDYDDGQVEKVIFIADEEKRALMKQETEKN